jgi:ribosome-binding protein aMBF1 (putative translation factor)
MYAQDWTPVVFRKKTPPPPSPTFHTPKQTVVKRPSKELAHAMMDARLTKKLKQSDLARMCNVTPAIINDMEMGRGTYDADVTNRVCKALGIHVKHRFISVDTVNVEPDSS